MPLEPDVLKILAGVRVLLVEGDATARELLESVLTYCSALVTCAADVQDALAYFESTPTDVAIVDVTLPDDEGYRLAGRIAGRVPVLALTAARDDGHDRALAVGVRASLSKPIDPWELCRRIAGLARKA